MDLKKEFFKYLNQVSKANLDQEQLFEQYYNLLLDENKKINLFSRKMKDDEVWSVHFMDSISIAQIYPDISNETILDFGSGGGLPGIPINILFPDNRLVFLDSILKKTNSIKYFCKKLDLYEAKIVCSRLEDLDSVWYGKFDRILCRSVKILPQYKSILAKLLKANGVINLYKAKQIDDVKMFKNYQTYDVSNEILGERKIIEIKNG